MLLLITREAHKRYEHSIVCFRLQRDSRAMAVTGMLRVDCYHADVSLLQLYTM
jgi:hypothetical protein